jgi:hypothetical protein
MPQSTDLLQGMLDLLIMQSLALKPMLGWGVAQRLQRLSKDWPPGVACPRRSGLYLAGLRRRPHEL